VAFVYRNAGYVCLAEVVERACGYRFEDFARRRVFEPLGMARTCYWSGPDPHPSGAEPFWPADQPVPLSLGDGGVWSTLQDLMRWNDAFLHDELGGTELMSTLGRLDDGTMLHYAWGFGIPLRRGQPVHSAGGNVPGMTGTLRRLPHAGRGIAVLTQTDGVERILRLTDHLVDRFW
jgi:CubicO group peptidase (beta-lactamase class C family)